MSQYCSSEKGEKVLENTGNVLTKFDKPFEFLKWEKLGASEEPIETCFIVRTEDEKKI